MKFTKQSVSLEAEDNLICVCCYRSMFKPWTMTVTRLQNGSMYVQTRNFHATEYPALWQWGRMSRILNVWPWPCHKEGRMMRNVCKVTLALVLPYCNISAHVMQMQKSGFMVRSHGSITETRSIWCIHHKVMGNIWCNRVSLLYSFLPRLYNLESTMNT